MNPADMQSRGEDEAPDGQEPRDDRASGEAPGAWRDEVRPDHGNDARGLVRSDNLGGRLLRLAPGHPSSPYDTDGTRRPPVIRLRDLELPEPLSPAGRNTDQNELPEHSGQDGLTKQDLADDSELRPMTDAEYAEHLADVRARLEKARSDGLSTDHQHTTDPDRREWSWHRNWLQAQIVQAIYGRAGDVPREFRAILAGGLGGAGKSTVLEKHAQIDRSKYLTINPDDIKEEMASRGLVPEVEGLSPMEASDLAHEESSYIAKRLALRATADGTNVIWDITMASKASTERRIDDLRAAGYTNIDGIFVDIPVESSVRRAAARHRDGHDLYRAGEGQGGRYVPAEVIQGQADPIWGSENRKTFEDIKGLFDSWSIFDNSADGRPPQLVGSSNDGEKTSLETSA
ncbi:MAG: zeta toxin family protein [Streptosporangiaceae bacterium]